MNLQSVTVATERESRSRSEQTRQDAVTALSGNVPELERSVGVLKDEKEMKRLLEQTEKMASLFDRNLKFRYRKEADIYQVEVIDAGNDQVVRKIPPDEMVRFIEHINEMLGALFDTQA